MQFCIGIFVPTRTTASLICGINGGTPIPGSPEQFLMWASMLIIGMSVIGFAAEKWSIEIISLAT